MNEERVVMCSSSMHEELGVGCSSSTNEEPGVGNDVEVAEDKPDAPRWGQDFALVQIAP